MADGLTLPDTGSASSRFRVTEAELRAHEAQVRAEMTPDVQTENPVLAVAAYIRKCFEAAKQAWENELHDRLLRCLRQKNGEYDPDILAKIRAALPGGSEHYRNITQIKCKAFEGWANSTVFPQGDKCWAFAPTPSPELPENKVEEIGQLVTDELKEVYLQRGIGTVPLEKINKRILEVKDRVKKEIVKDAKLSAMRIEQVINDQLTEGKYYGALRQCVLDMAVFPVCWLTGPEIRKRKKFKWDKDEEGNPKLVVIDKIVREYRRVSPYNIFPSANSKNIQDGYLCELIDLKRSELAAMIGVDGFDEATIRKVLQLCGDGGLREWVASDSERKEAENKPHADDDPNPPIQAVVFWGECQGSKLIEWGVKDEAGKVAALDPDIDYQITGWLIGTYVVMCRLNPSPLGTKPYYATSFDKINDSIVGNAIPEVMRDDQMRCCGAGRAIDNNMAFASGPMIEAYWRRFKPGVDIRDQFKPYGILETEDDISGSANPAVRFYQATVIAEVLMKIDQYFLQQAGDKTIPAYVYGNTGSSGSGATDTASGLSMMMNANLKNLQGAISHFETDIIIPSITEHWSHVMLYDDDIEKCGDVAIVAKASEHLLVEEQRQLRTQELLQKIAASESLKAITGDKGLANMLREAIKITKMDPDGIVPSEEEMEQKEQAQQQLQQMIQQLSGGGQQGAVLQPGAAVAPDGGQMGNEPGRVM